MQLTFYGHATFSVNIDGKTILFDPFFTGNPSIKNVDINSLKPDFIFITHGHGDHIGDAVAIAQNSGATVVAAPEVGHWLSTQGVEKLHPINHGSPVDFGFGKVRAVNALHSSGLPDGSYGANPFGFVFTSSEGNFYFAGDTGLAMDMQLIPYWTKLDFAVLPIGGNFTMDYNDAAIASDFIKCDKIVGVHYNTFDLIKIDTEAAQELFKSKGKTLVLLQPNEVIDL
ncbi:hydrolase [Arachidicoccus ginsenosidimutans]|uniref:metal-dependent hydrolase n=1 Tax=Arachidicoccus sp. BS20 TaxID=1850526 RepID=UPI0007F09B32|nr:metal-dependent hydrolase [Arachidicoccus sp. BS20]ANI90703.1 hydrolase [Arachidicoccus sp. BS20]